MRVGFDATAAATPRPTGVGLSLRHLVGALRDLESSEDLELDVLYRVSRVRRREQFLPGPYHLFHERLSVLRARRLEVFHGADTRLPRFSGPAFVATVHDLSARRPSFASARFRRTREAHWARVRERADLVMVYTQAIKDELVAELGLAAERVAVVPLAPTASPPAPDDAQAVCARIAGARPFFLCLGELSARKNTERAVEALGASGLDDHALVLAGPDGTGAEATRAAIKRLGLGDRVVLPSYLSAREVACLLSQARALVFPSRYEGFGMPVLEAFRADLPVIASTAASVVEVAGGGAVHHDPDDTQAFADSLRVVTEDAELRQRLVADGRERLQAFSWERSARRLLAVYRAAAARQSAPEEAPCSR